LLRMATLHAWGKPTLPEGVSTPDASPAVRISLAVRITFATGVPFVRAP
jgi:hypothetical protein